MKRITALLLAILICLSVAGCNNGDIIGSPGASTHSESITDSSSAPAEPEAPYDNDPTPGTGAHPSVPSDPSESQPFTPTEPEETLQPTLPDPVTPTDPAPTVKPVEPEPTIPPTTAEPSVPTQPSNPKPCNHSYTPGYQQNATCTTAGYQNFTCKKCGQSEQMILPPTPHNYAPANCITPKKCQSCGTTEGSALGHSFKNGTCTRCQIQDPDYEGSAVIITVYVRGSDSKDICGASVTIKSFNGQTLGTGTTDSKGLAYIPLSQHPGTYQVLLNEIPAAYEGRDSYRFSSDRANITLTLKPVITPDDHSQANYAAGQKMGDFTIKDTNGTTYKLAELLKTKKLVILNFWFSTCGPCRAEFPYFEAIYQQYSGQLEILAMNHIDSEATIKNFKSQNRLSFPMLREDLGMGQGFKLQGYPTTVYIGQDGTILKIQVGSYPSEDYLRAVIESYL